MNNESSTAESSHEALQWETEPEDVGTHEITVSTPDDSATKEIRVYEPPAFDIELIDMTDTPEGGEPVNFEVELTNPGELEGETELTLSIDGNTEDRIETVSLTPDNPKRKTLTWNPSEDDATSTYDVVIQTDTDDVSRFVYVYEPAFFDISIESIPDVVEAGDDIDVEVRIENTGQVSDTQTVSLQVDRYHPLPKDTNYTADSKEVDLNGGRWLGSDSTEITLTYSTTKKQHWVVYNLTVATDGDGSELGREVELQVPVDFSKFNQNIIRYNAESSGGSTFQSNDFAVNASSNTVPDNGNWPRAVGSSTPFVSQGSGARIGWNVIQGDLGYPSANILELREQEIDNKLEPNRQIMSRAIGQETINLGTYDSGGSVGEQSIEVDLADEINDGRIGRDVDFSWSGDDTLLSVRLDVDVVDRHVPDTGGGYIHSVDPFGTVEVRLNYSRIEVEPRLNVAWIRNDHPSDHFIYFETAQVFDQITGGRETYDENWANRKIEQVPDNIHPRNRIRFRRYSDSTDPEEIKEDIKRIVTADFESDFENYDPDRHTLVDCTLDVTPDSDRWPDLTGGRLTSVTDTEARYKINLAKGGARAYITIAYVVD